MGWISFAHLDIASGSPANTAILTQVWAQAFEAKVEGYTDMYFHFFYAAREAAHNVMMHAMDQMQRILDSVTYGNCHSAHRISALMCWEIILHLQCQEQLGFHGSASHASLIMKERRGGVLFLRCAWTNTVEIEKSTAQPCTPPLRRCKDQ